MRPAKSSQAARPRATRTRSPSSTNATTARSTTSRSASSATPRPPRTSFRRRSPVRGRPCRRGPAGTRQGVALRDCAQPLDRRAPAPTARVSERGPRPGARRAAGSGRLRPVGDRRDEGLAELVWTSAAGLRAEEYALLDMHVRRGLSADELADSLGCGAAPSTPPDPTAEGTGERRRDLPARSPRSRTVR